MFEHIEALMIYAQLLQRLGVKNVGVYTLSPQDLSI